MMHLSEEDLILLYYREPGVGREARSHLMECAECRAAAAALARTLNVCNEWTAPERPEHYGRDVWAQLAPELTAGREKEHGWRWLTHAPGFRMWAGAAGFAILLVAVFLAGRYSRSSEVAPVMAGLSDQARQRIVAIAVADHLDRVQILMTEIANTSGTDAAGFKTRRERAEDLVHEGRLVRQTLALQGESATTNFLDEVERFLIETAHAPDSATPAQVDDLRDRMESGALLFKVRIVESNLRNEEQRL